MATWLLIGPLFVAIAIDPPPASRPITLRGEVLDADTGRPIPCRLSIRGEDGAWHIAESASPQGSAVPYRKAAIGHPEIVEVHATLSAHPFAAMLAPGRY